MVEERFTLAHLQPASRVTLEALSWEAFMSNPNELVVNPQNADAAANEKVYIADLLVEQHDPEQVRACFAALDGDDLLRNVNNLKHARETMAWHMLL